MKILISGATGLIGKALQEFLKSHGHEIFILERDQAKVNSHAIYWNPKEGTMDLPAIEGMDAVVNLAGANISNRWTKTYRKEILQSRLLATQTLVNSFAKLKSPPKTFVSISAVGFYGDSGVRVCTESTPNGKGFLADVCRQWEQASQVPASSPVRVVNLRLGMVLSAKGGALHKMLIPFKYGLGGPVGSGEQYMSWVMIDDVVNIILFAITNPSLKGPVNVVAPNPVTNAEFTKALGKALHRPTIFRVPAFTMEWIFGKEMADEILLASTCVDPIILKEAGYSFLYSDIDKALIKLIKK